jgi:hypothetical protein
MLKKLNYAIGYVSGIDGTTLTLKAGHTITTDTGETNKFRAVFFAGNKNSPFQDENREIVEAYRTDTNTFIITREQEGTSAGTWIEDDRFMLIASSGVFDEYETELDKKAEGPASSVDENVAVFNGITGKIIKDGGKKVSDFEDSANKKTDLTDNSDTYYPSQKAVKTAVDAKADDANVIKKDGLVDYTGNQSMGSNKLTSLANGTDANDAVNKSQLDGKQDTLTFGIANDNAVEIDDADVADNDYAKFTANGLEGRSYAEVKQDLDLEVGTDVAAVNQAMHIGTTEVAINRGSAALTLAGITLTAPALNTSITTDYLTPSEIVISDANKKIVSAPVATYPSLTELSYVKGVTSAIQTQLGDKANSANAMGSINHGATAGTARPTGYYSITWIGTVEPTNATNNDIWIDIS